jgi:hypothetical protein
MLFGQNTPINCINNVKLTLKTAFASVFVSIRNTIMSKNSLSSGFSKMFQMKKKIYHSLSKFFVFIFHYELDCNFRFIDSLVIGSFVVYLRFITILDEKIKFYNFGPLYLKIREIINFLQNSYKLS